MIVMFTPEEVRELVWNREHWFFVFGPTHIYLVDELDKLLDHNPTYPTIFTPIVMTIVPKMDLPKHRVTEILAELTGIDYGTYHGSEDIFPIIDKDGKEAGPIFQAFAHLLQI